MHLLVQLFEIFTLGLIGGSVPGPMLTAVFTEILRGGLTKGFRVIGQALLAETLVATGAMLLVFSLHIPQQFFYIISFVGAAFLLYLAKGIWKITSVGEGTGTVFTFSKIFLLTVLSGAFWIFWLTVCVPRAFALQEIIPGGQFIFLFMFEFGWLIMTGLLAFVFSRFRQLLLKKNLVSVVFKTFALLLIFFALKSLWESIMYFIK